MHSESAAGDCGLRDSNAGATGVGHGSCQGLIVAGLHVAEVEARRICGEHTPYNSGTRQGDIERWVGSIAGKGKSTARRSRRLRSEDHVEIGAALARS